MFLKKEKVFWKLFDKSDSDLADLYYTLDNIIKERTELGLGHVESTQVIKKDLEDKMWKDGVLGQDYPHQLLDIVMYLLGINLTLHGGIEHKKLRHPGFDSQLEVGNDPAGKICLVFTEDPKTKINQGGLERKAIAPRKLLSIHVMMTRNVQ